MEDPVEEWENEQEYMDLGYGEEEVSQSKISRILSGGLWLGKKIVITGFFISSAPVVLPPLVVMSALGFAVSIPFGVVLAGYTCTEKLMNKLLPMPEASGMLDYKPPQLVLDRAEEDVGEENEKKEVHDMKESVEMRIELAEKENKEGQPEMEIKNSERDVKAEAQSEVLLEGSWKRERQDEKSEPVVTRVVVAKPVEGEIEISSGKSEEMEVHKAESTSLLDKIKDEGSQSGESAKKNKKKSKERLKKSLGLGGKKEDKSAKNTKQTEKDLNKVAAGTGKKDDEISTDEKNINIEISGDDRENAQVVESQSVLINGNEEVSSKVVEKQANQGPEMQYTAASIKHEDKPVESSTIHKESTGEQYNLSLLHSLFDDFKFLSRHQVIEYHINQRLQNVQQRSVLHIRLRVS